MLDQKGLAERDRRSAMHRPACELCRPGHLQLLLLQLHAPQQRRLMPQSCHCQHQLQGCEAARLSLGKQKLWVLRLPPPLSLT